jgi:predicted peptidase
MDQRLHVLTLAGLLAGCASVSSSLPVAGHPAPQSLQRRFTRDVTLDYLLYLPAGIELRGPRRYPLMIFLHGSGEAGHELGRLERHGPPKIAAGRPDFPFILAAPQIADAEQGFDPVALDALLDELLERLPVDPDRVYLTGLSLGGQWTYAWASLRPERFAALAPIAGNWTPEVACRLKQLPVWAFHGARDDVVPLDGDRAMVDAINACGGHAHLSVYADAGHDAWTAAYANTALYEWLLAQRRGATGPVTWPER